MSAPGAKCSVGNLGRSGMGPLLSTDTAMLDVWSSTMGDAAHPAVDISLTRPSNIHAAADR
ncbi:hypothetical protein [Comamonas sp. 4034]|uniref:hypothetical protein n=1 Tax=Comamonas sp. 4034 TaxID=3156455 RepID=UPI003D215BA7